jgi:hypothetical protein
LLFWTEPDRPTTVPPERQDRKPHCQPGIVRTGARKLCEHP